MLELIKERLMSSSFIIQQIPTYVVCLTWVVSSRTDAVWRDVASRILFKIAIVLSAGAVTYTNFISADG